MEDDIIIQLFWARSQDALAQTQSKYGNLLLHIAGNILHDPRDAEEAAADTYLRLWNSIPPNRPQYLQAYAAKLARNAALDILRTKYRGKRDNRSDILFSELDACIPSPQDIGARLDEQELAAMINRYLRTLDSTSRNLFIRRYFAMEELDELAADFAMAKHTISSRLYRIRKGLQQYLRKEGIAV